MSEMIDRVENAIAEAMGRDSAAYRGCYTKAARAAIEAMRTPTEAMVDEATIDGCPPRLVWSIMLDAALSEKP